MEKLQIHIPIIKENKKQNIAVFCSASCFPPPPKIIHTNFVWKKHKEKGASLRNNNNVAI